MGEAVQSEMVVKRDLRAVAEVRTFVRLVTGGWDVDDFVPCLIASELVTNALRYATAADDEVIFRIGRTDRGVVWVEVQDSVCVMPRIISADVNGESGRGLFVVEQFTRCWGARPLAGDVGKVVFAVLNS
ncbi:ATP-binding protein [Actinomadura sp. KC06]|uniref:ATP-binding protein n=1 Tax=Actinomadura sp. KC06 TaxID=2530369 RepID=UPI001045E75E|nr:ATP-binding protein [Actinomadura sp. KC06]TDD27780.1 ATP-binding protein [Actinomadura sp. KC06]